MAASKLMFVVVVVMAIATFRLPSALAQTRHVVGGEMGWAVPNNGNSAYTTWASGQTFNVGDTLFFNFTTGAHDVTEVTQSAYGPCTATNPISHITNGPATVTLRTPGNHYYICTVGPHCQLGQKLTINVGGATANAPNSGGPAPAGGNTPPAPSSAASMGGVVTVTLLAVVLALFTS